MSSGGPAAGVEVASAERKDAGEQEQEDAREPGAGKTKFSEAGVKPPVAPTTQKAAPSASDQAFGPSAEVETGATPESRFRAAVGKHDPTAIAIAGKSATVIGASITKDPALAAAYFEIVAANRSDAYREPLKALFSHLTIGDKKKLFAAQYGFAITEKAAGHNRNSSEEEFEPDQIDKMYEAAQLLPASHMIGNPKFKKLEAGEGARYFDKQDTIEMPSDPWASTGVMEDKYGPAFRHEVGHAVDFALLDKTNKLRDEFGWNVITDPFRGGDETDLEKMAAHLERLGMMRSGLDAKSRADLTAALQAAISGGDDYITTHLTHFFAYEKEEATALIARGVTPLWKERAGAFNDAGITIGDQHYFSRGYGSGGWAYSVKKSTYDAAPEKGKVSHHEWFAEWYATYYATSNHAGVTGRLKEFFHDEVDSFNQQRSTLGTPEAKDGTGGTTPRHM